MIQEGASANDSAVQRAREGIVDDADAGDAVDGETEGDGDVRVGVDEVRRAVYGVDYERWSVGQAVARLVGLFAHEPWVSR